MSQSLEQDRKLRVFAFDPHVGKQLAFRGINEATISIPHSMERPREKDRHGRASSLRPGPVGEYFEVIDYDPVAGLLYRPVDLERYAPSQGLAPSEANPQFHQQMAYAVAMRTVALFEAALGRVALWAPKVDRNAAGIFKKEEYVGRVRIYPHALREANAYYSPEKKALLFGYFEADGHHPSLSPGTTVFTCLSHDIVAHETTHALLDGMRSRFTEATNLDVLALHEAVADCVALFQHFSLPEVLVDAIARSRGNLEAEGMMAQLAQEFGRALGRGGALRDALGEVGPNGVWQRQIPDRSRLARARGPHGRGAILVAALFDAFIGIYRSRTADLLRIATGGTGVLPPGALHPDLVGRLAKEASKSAEHILGMCIRALDYCPPVDVRFGDYLRAIVTADHDLVPDDEHGYRTAVVEAFVAWGIVPDDLSIVSEESLLWPALDDIVADANAHLEGTSRLAAALGTLIENPKGIMDWLRKQAGMPARVAENLNQLAEQISRRLNEQERARRDQFDPAKSKRRTTPRLTVEQILSRNLLQLGLDASREVEWLAQRFYGQLFWAFLIAVNRRELLTLIGIKVEPDAPATVNRSPVTGLPTLHVQSVRMATRRGTREQPEREYVIEVVQARRGYFDREEQNKMDKADPKSDERGQFTFRRGCTLLVDARTFAIRRVIRTPGHIADDDQMDKVRQFVAKRRATPTNALDGGRFEDPLLDEDFAHLHRSVE